MFYAQFVLSKKGPLAKIWLAAHWEKKLSKAQIFETNVQDAVEEIMQPKTKLALRTTGHLLLGIVRIYSRKAKYLLTDCNEAFMKIKMAFRTGQDVVPDAEHQPISNALNFQEVLPDFDTALHDFNDIDIHSLASVHQSRIDDITLREDPIPESADIPYGSDFGGDDFGEHSLGFCNDDKLEFPRDRSAGLEHVDFVDATGTTLEHTLESEKLQGDLATKHIDLELDHLGLPDADDFDDFGADNMIDDVLFNENELTKGIDAIEPPGVDKDMSMEIGDIGCMDGLASVNASAASGTLGSDSFALEPLDPAVVTMAGMEKASRVKKKRRLIIDEQRTITSEEMKANMADYRDTLQPLDLAPPTKKLMHLRETGNVDYLFNNPGCSFLQSSALLKLYRSRLTFQPRTTRRVTTDEIRRDLEMLDDVDEPHEVESEASGLLDDHLDDYDDLSPVDSPVPVGSLNGEERKRKLRGREEEEIDSKRGRGELNNFLQRTEEVVQKSAIKDTTTTERKRERKSRGDRALDEDDGEFEDEHRWTKRTQNVLVSISTRLKASTNNQIVLSDLLTKGSTRKTVAQKFYTLLVLKKWQAIDVEQDEPYGDIKIVEGPSMEQFLSA